VGAAVGTTGANPAGQHVPLGVQELLGELIQLSARPWQSPEKHRPSDGHDSLSSRHAPLMHPVQVALVESASQDELHSVHVRKVHVAAIAEKSNGLSSLSPVKTPALK
jgi:hypothetical protein